MRLHLPIISGLCLAAIVANAQNKYPEPAVNIGDPAPTIRVRSWMKGDPVTRFEKGKVYVVEFWATWCRPCKAGMPYLSALARKYRDKVTVLGISVRENEKTTLSQIKAFVDTMGSRMDYNVAAADSNMYNDWFTATGEGSLPNAFIIDREGRLAWMDHPCNYFEDALDNIVNDTWDINEALEERKRKFRLLNLEDSLVNVLEFGPDGHYRNGPWTRDSAILLVEKAAKIEPLIQYTPRIAYQIFSILVKADPKKAYEFGKKVIETSTYEKPAGFFIKSAIENTPPDVNLTPEIYQIGIAALQVEINEMLACLPEIRNIAPRYYRMAQWYSLLGNNAKAIEAQEKAIEDMKAKGDYTTSELAAYEEWFRYFQKNEPGSNIRKAF